MIFDKILFCSFANKFAYFAISSTFLITIKNKYKNYFGVNVNARQFAYETFLSL